MKVRIAIERSTLVELPRLEVQPMFGDIESTIGRFPKLRRLTRLGENQYLRELQTLGSRLANIAYDVVYGARYRLSADGSELSWEPLPDKGNARIAGAFRVLDAPSGTEIRFRVQGELRDVPVPLMYRLAAPPFIQGKFTHLVDSFLERTRAALLQRR
jgi:hypothetical protein